MNALYNYALLIPPFWLGMVIAISFIEAPIKFKAPGVSLVIGLGIGRLVFRALNSVEVVLNILLLIGWFAGISHNLCWAPPIALTIILLLQVLAVRPFLTKRSDQVLQITQYSDPDAPEPPRSKAHLAYVFLEILKVLVLGATCILIISHLQNLAFG